MGEWWDSLTEQKKREWVVIGVVLVLGFGIAVWLVEAEPLGPLPEGVQPTVQEEQAQSEDDRAARTALGNEAVEALREADVAAAIARVEVYGPRQVTVTLFQAKEELGSDAEVSGIAQGVAAVLFAGTENADMVFVHDGNGKTIGRFDR